MIESNEKEIIFCSAVLKETVWGGEKLSSFGFSLPSATVGEAWLSSAHPNGESVITSGKYKGLTLSSLYDSHRFLFGNITSKEFPLLTKIIDAKNDLSVQVHPDDEYALKNENGSYGKTECWYVLESDKNASIIVGHKGNNKAEVTSLIESKKWNEFLCEEPVKKSDFFYIPAGTVHAIKGGTLILETQQTSDITYRVYDYDRLTNGKPRELHIQKSIDVIKSPYKKSVPPKNENKTLNKNLLQLVSSDFFTVWKLDVNGTEKIDQDQKFLIVTVIEGSGFVCEHPIAKGTSFIIPYEYGSVSFSGQMQLILSTV